MFYWYITSVLLEFIKHNCPFDLVYKYTRQNPAWSMGNVNFLIAIEDEYTAVRME